ncbi:hypothetical protein VPH35_099188 [Triticum aestivum]
MEATMVEVVHTLATILILWLIWRSLWHLVWRPYAVAGWFERQGIRGPPYRFVLGSLWEMKQMLIAERTKAPLDISSHDYTSRINPFFHKWAADYVHTHTGIYSGKTFLYWLGPVPTIYSTDLEPVEQVLEDRTELFQKDYLNPSLERIFGKGLLTTNGDDWKWHRRVVYPIFYHENLKSVSAMTTESTQKMIVQWCNLIEKGDGHQAKIDMGCYAEELTLGVIERVIFGAHYKEAREVFTEGKEIQKLAVRAFADPRIPGLRSITSKIIRLIKDRLASGVDGDDLIGLMLWASKSEEVKSLSSDEMIGECKTNFAAGQDTGATLLIWGMFLLTIYPEWQERLREEVLRECGDDDGDARYSNIIQHRSKEIWGRDADEFNPMRLEKGSLGAVKNMYAMLAFSCGPRGCPGRNYAMIEVQTVMAMILRRFSFSLSSQYVHMPRNFLTLSPRYGLPLIVRHLLDGEKK